MAKLSKRENAIRAKLTPGKLYPVEEAFAFLKDVSKVKFPESVEVAVNLGVDPRKSDQVVRGSTVLPNGTGKQVRWPCSRRARMPMPRPPPVPTGSASRTSRPT